MTETFLQARREQLLALLAEMRPVAKDSIAIERHADAMDQAVSDRIRELSENLATRDAQKAKQIVAALDRIADGEYGTCDICGEEISAARLKAVPFAKRCTPCQEAVDRGEVEAD